MAVIVLGGWKNARAMFGPPLGFMARGSAAIFFHQDSKIAGNPVFFPPLECP